MRSEIEIRAELHQAEAEVRRLQGELHVAVQAQELKRQKEQIAAGVSNACGRSWRPDRSCSYCGSMSVAEAIRRLKTPGTRYSGADWKYGWPHKFYIELGGYPTKFYNKHLKDASPEEFAEFAELSNRLLDVQWMNDAEDGISWRAVPGVQRHGIVGEAGLPVPPTVVL